MGLDQSLWDSSITPTLGISLFPNILPLIWLLESNMFSMLLFPLVGENVMFGQRCLLEFGNASVTENKLFSVLLLGFSKTCLLSRHQN